MGATPDAFGSIAGLAARLRTGGLSPVTLAEQLMERIEALDKRLRSFILVTPQRALAGQQLRKRCGVNRIGRRPVRGRETIRPPRADGSV